MATGCVGTSRSLTAGCKLRAGFCAVAVAVARPGGQAPSWCLTLEPVATAHQGRPDDDDNMHMRLLTNPPAVCALV